MNKLIEELSDMASRVAQAGQNGAHVAELYADLSDIEQAVFFHTVAKEFEAVGSTVACRQNAAAARFMTEVAKEYVKNLAEHIRLIEEEGV